jgi:hypothetical protein
MLKKANMPIVLLSTCAGLIVGFMTGDVLPWLIFAVFIGVLGVMPTKPNQMGFHRFQSAGSPARALYALMLGR